MDTIKKNIMQADSCEGCNWICKSHFIKNLGVQDLKSCPCAKCIVKMMCCDTCEKWNGWAIEWGNENE